VGTGRIELRRADRSARPPLGEPTAVLIAARRADATTKE
jgi:hypothetical protein